MPRQSKIGFLRQYFERFLETRYVKGDLSVSQYNRLKRALDERALRSLRKELFREVGQRVWRDDIQGYLRVVELRDIGLRKFWFLQIEKDSSGKQKPLNCFVGHRFYAHSDRIIRYNLRTLLDPFRIRLDWSGADLQAASLFDDIVDKIANASFCIFDNFGTLNKPNVYIEAGIAYALDRPMILCEYVGRSNPQLDTGSVPSDLAGILRIQYDTYHNLCEQLYFGMPSFLSRHGLIE